MTPAQALADIRGFAAANRITIHKGHPSQRARERHVPYRELRHALMNATSTAVQPNERWSTRGPDLDGDELTIIVIIESGVIVCTVF